MMQNKMRIPIDIKIDYEIYTAVLHYGSSASRKSIPVGNNIIFDIDENNNLLDIEFMSLSRSKIDEAKKLALDYQCDIPDDIRLKMLQMVLFAKYEKFKCEISK